MPIRSGLWPVVTLALTELFDLIVMDIQLPGTDGLTATRVLLANEQTAHIPVLSVIARDARRRVENHRRRVQRLCRQAD